MEKREHRSPMEKVQQPNSKKARVDLAPALVKQEAPEEEGQSSGGAAGATVAVEVAAPRLELAVTIDKAKLHCPRCTAPFKPPVFQFLCEAAHLACSACHDLLPKNKCYSCHQDGAYTRIPLLESYLGSFKIPCPYDVYGCGARVAYVEAGDHQRKCPCAPCRCAAEPGCAFVGSPPMLRDHLRDAHAWPVDKVRYGRPLSLRLPESQPRRLLDAAEDDGRVFLVSRGAHGATVACVRAAAAAGPAYSCTMCATGNPGPETGQTEMAWLWADVRSISSVPGGAVADAAPLLYVPRTMLHGASMEMHLSVTIEKVTK